MAKKETSESVFDLGGLITAQTQPSENVKQETKDNHQETSAKPSAASFQSGESKDYERFNFICDKSLASKARAISRKEGFTIRALMEKAMTDFFDKYEAKNGAVGELTSRNINDVL